jgi:hypothetical protein
MHDPFPIAPPERLVQYVQPIADYLSLKTLPLHIHEVLIAFSLYYATHQWFAPFISNLLVPRQYASFNARTRLSWNVHIVSLVQSTLVCTMALWVMWKDTERKDMNWSAKVHGYTGGTGLIQAFAGGYFVWDFVITVQNMHVFGPGMLAHAVSALFVFALGFVSYPTISARQHSGNTVNYKMEGANLLPSAPSSTSTPQPLSSTNSPPPSSTSTGSATSST